MNYDTLHPLNHMSLINLEEFKQLKEDYPELAQCYHLSTFTQPKETETDWDNFEEDWRTHA